MKITSAHGGGGKLMNDLIHDVFARNFSSGVLSQMEDAAVLSLPTNKIAFTTDSFVVTPLFFKGGDIGRIAVCGTVNDLLMRGATPRYLSVGFILEEGLEIEILERVVRSMKNTCDEAHIQIVAGDTKVIEGKGGLYINTAGIGTVETSFDISVHNAEDQDTVIVSGYMGNHHACILSSRMGIENNIESDCAPLNEMVKNLIASGIELHAMRDITRGGLASVLNEIAQSSNVKIELFHDVPLADDQVQGFCDILGLDPLYMGNEGKLALILPKKDANRAIEIIKASKYGKHAQIVGNVNASKAPVVTIKTRSGGTRVIEPLLGEGLPRIC